MELPKRKIHIFNLHCWLFPASPPPTPRPSLARLNFNSSIQEISYGSPPSLISLYSHIFCLFYEQMRLRQQFLRLDYSGRIFDIQRAICSLQHWTLGVHSKPLYFIHYSDGSSGSRSEKACLSYFPSGSWSDACYHHMRAWVFSLWAISSCAAQIHLAFRDGGK